MKINKVSLSVIVFLSLYSNVIASEYAGYSNDKKVKENKQATVYENGFHHGINCVEREFKFYQKRGEKVKFKRWMVYMDISSLPREEILIYKNYAYEEGMIPVSIEGEKLVFKSFDREADASYLATVVLSKYISDTHRIKIKKNNPMNNYKIGNFIYSEIFEKIKASLAKEVIGKVFISNGAYKEVMEGETVTVETVGATTMYAPIVPVQTYSSSSYIDEQSLYYADPYIESVKSKSKPKKVVKKISKKKKKYFLVKDSKAEIFKRNDKHELVSNGFIASGSQYSYKVETEIDGVQYIKYKDSFIEVDDIKKHYYYE
jgi:hypothetical protein